jgi:uncharacterized protein (TIGR02996 family)
MPPPGHEPFLAAIIASPDDDLPRLVYADWLDENGDPARAEFIRVQCELAGLGLEWVSATTRVPRRGDTDRSERVNALLRRHHELWHVHWPGWRAELPKCPGTILRFSRGFAGWADVTHTGGIMKDGQRLFAVAPVSWLSFRDCPATMVCTPIESASWFAGVRKLSVAWRTPDDADGDRIAEALAASQHAGGLRELYLSRADLSDRGVIDLARSGCLGRLVRADLSYNRIGNKGAEVLAESLSPDKLVSLDLTRCPMLDEYRRNLLRRFPDKIVFRQFG